MGNSLGKKSKSIPSTGVRGGSWGWGWGVSMPTALKYCGLSQSLLIEVATEALQYIVDTVGL